MRPLRLVVMYTHKDEHPKDMLQTHLRLLQHQGLVERWKNYTLSSDQLLRREIEEQLHLSDVIVLLVSPAFIATGFCQELEFEEAIQRHKEGIAIIIPILVHPVELQETPLADIQTLPKDAKPMSCWNDSDGAWPHVAESLKTLLQLHIRNLDEETQKREQGLDRALNRIEIYDSVALSPSGLEQLVSLDKRVYDEDECVALPIAYAWHLKNPRGGVFAKDKVDSRIAGYMGAIPLNKSAFDRTLDSDFSDSDIMPEDIEIYQRSGLYYLYLLSIVVHPMYQKTTIVYKKLFDGFFRFLLDLASDDIYVRVMSARAVTPIGIRIGHSLGMQHVGSAKHGVQLFRATMLPPTIRAATKEVGRVMKRYNDKYNELRESGILEKDVKR